MQYCDELLIQEYNSVLYITPLTVRFIEEIIHIYDIQMCMEHGVSILHERTRFFLWEIRDYW